MRPSHGRGMALGTLPRLIDGAGLPRSGFLAFIGRLGEANVVTQPDRSSPRRSAKSSPWVELLAAGAVALPVHRTCPRTGVRALQITGGRRSSVRQNCSHISSALVVCRRGDILANPCPRRPATPIRLTPRRPQRIITTASTRPMSSSTKHANSVTPLGWPHLRPTVPYQPLLDGESHPLLPLVGLA
jgi:hypothetical protein